LWIDTATEYVFLSLVIDGTEVGSFYKNDINNHAVTIMPMLDQLLKNAGLVLKNIDEVIVGVGPGSYTGVRIGVSIAKMIGYLNDIPVKTISTLALMASSSSAKTILALIDARRGNAFMAVYRHGENGLEEYISERLMNQETFIKTLPLDALLVTSGKPDVSKIINSPLLHEVPNIHELVPNYLQITEAERNKGKA
jgi:tRNA threonylcarbamoyladenosine biosynthesis protein TsaB